GSTSKPLLPELPRPEPRPEPVPEPKPQFKPESKPEPGPEPKPDLLNRPLIEEPAPVRFVYHADMDQGQAEEVMAEQPEAVSSFRSRAVWGGALGLVAALILIGVYFYLKPSQTPTPPVNIAQKIP